MELDVQQIDTMCKPETGVIVRQEYHHTTQPKGWEVYGEARKLAFVHMMLREWLLEKQKKKNAAKLQAIVSAGLQALDGRTDVGFAAIACKKVGVKWRQHMQHLGKVNSQPSSEARKVVQLPPAVQCDSTSMILLSPHHYNDIYVPPVEDMLAAQRDVDIEPCAIIISSNSSKQGMYEYRVIIGRIVPELNNSKSKKQQQQQQQQRNTNSGSSSNSRQQQQQQQQQQRNTNSGSSSNSRQQQQQQRNTNSGSSSNSRQQQQQQQPNSEGDTSSNSSNREQQQQQQQQDAAEDTDRLINSSKREHVQMSERQIDEQHYLAEQVKAELKSKKRNSDQSVSRLNIRGAMNRNASAFLHAKQKLAELMVKQ
jgi:hypothetical protein